MNGYLGNKEFEISFLILKKDVVRIAVNFLRTVVEVQTVIQILLISLRIQNRLLAVVVLQITLPPDE